MQGDTITAEALYDLYRRGLFPMADSRDAEHFNIYRPQIRGLLPIDDLHIPRSLQKAIRTTSYEVTINKAFTSVIAHCAESRKDTWINDGIITLFTELHEQSLAHSVEVWDNETLIGGLYGVSVGAIFCGESMFSLRPNASKIALVHLAAQLSHCGFKLLDTQFTNPHLEQFGAYELTQERYETYLEEYRDTFCDFAQS